jgi:hypothetical protein
MKYIPVNTGAVYPGEHDSLIDDFLRRCTSSDRKLFNEHVSRAATRGADARVLLETAEGEEPIRAIEWCNPTGPGLVRITL